MKTTTVEDTMQGWDLVFQQGVLLSHLPIEEWLAAFGKAESIAPILDPTLYRNYIYSGKGEVIKDVLNAALTFKNAILKAQKQVKENQKLQQQF
jgi:hypothetical protein